MGINNFKPTREDVKIWIEMGDTDNDGTISLDEVKIKQFPGEREDKIAKNT